MKINEIYKSICSHIENRTLTLYDNTLGITGTALSTFLDCTFDMPTLLLIEVTAELKDEVIHISSRANLWTQTVVFCMRLKEFSDDLQVEIHLEMEDACYVDFFGSRPFFSNNVTKEYTFLLQNYESVDYEVYGDISESFTLQDILDLVLPKFQSPFENIALENIRLASKRHWQLGECITFIGMKSTSKLELTQKITIEKLGIELALGEHSFGVALSGTIGVSGITLPLILRVQDKTFLFGLDTGEDGTMLPSIDFVTYFAGMDVASALPEGFRSPGGLCLKSFILTLGDDFRFRTFSVQLETTDKWQLLGIKNLSLNDVILKFNATDDGRQTNLFGSIEGVINVGQIAVHLYGEKKSDGHYILQGSIPQGKELSLTALIHNFCTMLDISDISLPLPEIMLYNACLTFESDKKTFGSYVSISAANNENTGSLADRLFKIFASVNIKSSVSNGQRNLSGKFEGCLTIENQIFTVTYKFGSLYNDYASASWKWDGSGVSPLSLVNLVKAFGVSDIPDEVANLELACDEIALTYSISRKELECKVTSIKYGSLLFRILEDSNKNIQFMITITFISQIDLSNLPVVGTSLHLLDHISISSLLVEAATSDNWKDIKKGLRLKGSLDLCDESQSFELDITNSQKGLLSASTESSAVKWIELNKNLALFYFQRIGLTYRNGAVGFLLDASLSANPIEIGLKELGLGFKMSDITNISFYLSGLSLSYKNPSLSIAGAFQNSGTEEYEGMLTVQTKVFSLVAIGSYSKNSLFAYTLLSYPLGGPPAFFITGFAAGFGYNRDIETPEIEEVHTFPMVKAAFGTLSPSEMLSAMHKICTVSNGTNFITAGIRFSSFKMVDSFALATVILGKRLEITLLGLSNIDIPSGTGDTSTPVAHAQLALRCVCVPDDGYFSVMAQLTSESYILSKDCKITGGFAFYLWFAGSHKGDFVITLGGYRDNYKKPSHYPDVPRLGFLWNVTDELKLSGCLYFALTPSCIMAGGALSAVFQSGELRAWFEARADFLMSWKPYYYDIRIYIGLGVSYRLNLLFCKVTLKAELSADLQLWGPEFTGSARITWFIISFTIHFGNSKQGKKYIDWTDFEQSFLPHENSKMADGTQNDIVVGGVIEIASGKQAECEEKTLVVDSETLEIHLKTTVPCTQIMVNNTNAYKETKNIGILPMGPDKKLVSNCTISLYDSKTKCLVPSDASVLCENVPAALWGIADPPTDELIKDVAMGIKLSPKHDNTSNTLPTNYFLDLSKLIEYDKISKNFSWIIPVPVTGPSYHGEHSISQFSNTAMKNEVRNRRKTLIERFNKYGDYQFETDIHIETLANNAAELLYAPICMESII